MNPHLSICVLGTGAIGGLLGGAFANKGHNVTFVDRGARLAALQKHGLRILDPKKDTKTISCARFAGPDSIAAEFDMVLLAVKAHQIAELSTCLRRILTEDTPILTLQNGLPWWYFQQSGGPWEGTAITSLDPDGSIAASVPAGNIVGAVVYPAAELVEDGVVRHVEGDRFVLGELSGEHSDRVQQIADTITGAGLRGQTQTDIRGEIWLKTWGSLAFNTVSALTRSTMAEICRSRDTRALVTEMMRETEAVAEAVGIKMRVPLERRLAGAERVGEHKTSTLQDVEAGREMEVEAIIGSVLEIAEMTGVRMPQARTVYALIKLLNDRMAKNQPRDSAAGSIAKQLA